MKKRENSRGINCLVQNRDRDRLCVSASEYITESYNKKQKLNQIAEKRDEQLKSFDERYLVIVELFMNEIKKRKIDITAPEFTEKMEEILQKMSKGKFFQSRYSKDNMIDIKNTILRRVNLEIRKNNLKEER